MKSTYILAFIMLMLLAAGCGNGQQPTTISQQITATAVSPTSPPIDTPIPPTPTHLPPTSTAEPTQTAEPTPMPTATAVPNTLLASDTILAGADLTLSGTWDRQTAVSLRIVVHISDWLLAEGSTPIHEDGTWEITLPLPPQISGTAVIDVYADETAVPALSSQIDIVAAFDDDKTYITLDSPAVGETAVAGYAMFFHGVVNNPIRRTLEMGILHDDCSSFAARQVFELGTGSWSGFTVLPSDIPLGPACAIARTGDPESGDDWAAALVPLTIYAPDDAAATNILIGNPGELVFERGELVLLYGTAVNAPNNTVDILLNTDDGTFRLLFQAETAVNSYGYWEVEIPLPDFYDGFALLTISLGSGDSYFEHRTPVIITK